MRECDICVSMSRASFPPLQADDILPICHQTVVCEICSSVLGNKGKGEMTHSGGDGLTPRVLSFQTSNKLTVIR